MQNQGRFFCFLQQVIIMTVNVGAVMWYYQPVVVDNPENAAPADSIKAIPQITDSAKVSDMPRRDPQIMVKYGVMIPRQ